MSDKYHIQTVVTPGHFHRVGKYGSIDWREDCSRCTNCVKHRCVYDVYKHESAHNRDPSAAIQTLYACKACLSCVQGCTKGLLAIGVNPEYLGMGDDYWNPDLIATTWNQADTGRIPVSGAGYRGRFSGPGFDSIWTDMSEIVRPTRDGIHGREYISTMVDIGTKPMRLSFGPDGRMTCAGASLVEIQLPALLDVPARPMPGNVLSLARAASAHKLRTLAVIPAEHVAAIPAEQLASVVPLISGERTLELCRQALPRVRMVELAGAGDMEALAQKVAEINPRAILVLRMDLLAGTADRVSSLAWGIFKVFHLNADLHGCERLADGSRGRHIKDALREIHGRLVKDGRRDEITLIVGGGIALAEHMAKAIICGADLVAVSTPLLVSLGCRVCRDTPEGVCGSSQCLADLGSAELPYATQRMTNLMGAWHSQLIEVLGAMGIREVRRLRGEVGRAMFLEDIEKEAFGDLVRK
ncbi:MAG: glutamate synthase-related protein [Tepidisphaeraceae bacterium]